jgi:hypothetical protein
MSALKNMVSLARIRFDRLLNGRPGSPELWRGLLYGMSVSDVRWRIPSAYVPTSATTIRLPNVGDAIELLRIDNVISMTHDFTARLYFHRERLQQVTLSHHHEASNVLLMEGFGSLSTKLRRAYGPESLRVAFPAACGVGRLETGCLGKRSSYPAACCGELDWASRTIYTLTIFCAASEYRSSFKAIFEAASSIAPTSS